MVSFPDAEAERVKRNVEAGRPPDFAGHGKCYIGNLAFEVDEKSLGALFAKVGEVGEVAVVRDDTGRSRGFAFVTMVTKEDGEKAVKMLDGEELEGRAMQVKDPNN